MSPRRLIDNAVTPLMFSVNVVFNPKNGLCTPLLIDGFALP